MQEYNICFSLDSKYVEQFTVSAVSILKNADAADNINFYILDGGLTKHDKSNINLLKNIKTFNIEYIKMDDKEFKDVPLLENYHVTLPTYYRFKLPELLKEQDKVLYLDCDVIVRGSLKELYSIDLKDKAAAMAEDVESDNESQRLGLKQYFNAGVMLINLEYWRENEIESKLFDFASKNKTKILWQDQDVINCVLSGQIKTLSNKWNYQYFLYNKIDDDSLKNCLILHLAGRFKPWLIPFEHFIYNYYYYYLEFTPYKNRIIEYRQKANGKYLRDDIGGYETNILYRVTNEDIQKVYEEINKNYGYTSEVKDTLCAETDVKLDKIYKEIDKNYDFTKELAESSKQDISLLTEEKISKVYEEINKNYSYVSEVKDTLYAETDVKLDKIYKEIDKNYEFTKELTESAKQEINSLTDEKISKINEEITKDFNYVNEQTTSSKEQIMELKREFEDKLYEKTENITSLTDEKFDNVYKELSITNSQIDESHKQAGLKFDEIRLDFDKRLQNHIEQINSQTESQIDKIQSEISRNYDYANEIKGELNSKFSENFNSVNNEIEKLIINQENKISGIYGELSKNSKNFEELSANQNNRILTLEEKLPKAVIEINSATDEKIAGVYNEITKNYEYTNSIRDNAAVKIENVKSDILSVSSDVKSARESFEETKKLLNEKIDEGNKTIKSQILANEELLQDKILQSENTLNEKIKNKEEYILEIINSNEKTVKGEIVSLYEKAALNDETLKRDYNELKQIFFDNLNSQLEFITSQTDEKISKVYEEVSKNYDYTNKLHEENKDLAYQLKYDVEVQLKSAQDNLYSYIDHQNETAQNNAFSKAAALEKQMDERFLQLEDNQNRKNDLKISELYAYTNSELTKVFRQVSENTASLEHKVELKSYDAYKWFCQNQEEINHLRDNIQNKSDIHTVKILEEQFNQKLEDLSLEYQKQIQMLSSDYEEKLNSQRIKYENKLMTMENQISSLEEKYREREKGFFVKMIEKCKKR